MLLTVKPTRADSRVLVEKPEREADYRDDIAAYIPAKREKYLKKHKSTLLLSTLAALRKAFQSKISGAKGDDLRLYLVPTVYDVYDGRDGVGVDFSITDPTDVDRVFAKLTLSDSKRSDLQFLQLDPTTLAVHIKTDPVRIPSFGRYCIGVHNRSLFKKKKVFHEVYDFEEVDQIRLALREGQTRRVVMKIPCYSSSSAVRIANLRLPSTEIQLLVEVSGSEDLSSDGKFACTLVGARVVCSVHTDAHATLYTNRVQLEDHPTFDAGRAARTVSEIDRSIKDRPTIGSAAAAHSGGVTEVVQQTLNQILTKANDGVAPNFSWSVSHHDQVVFSHRGLDRHNVGHVGEVLFGVVALRAANGVSPTVWSDMNLCTPHGFEKLLRKAGKDKLHEALKELYSPHGRLPSVLELLTHASGLPQVGSIDAEVDIAVLEKLLPGSGRVPVDLLAKDPEARLTHVLSERVQLIAAPGSVVHFSNLGIAILAECFPHLPSTMKKFFSELGMDATRIVDAQDDSRSSPDDSVHRVTNCTYSTTNDLARFIACIEKANQDPTAHSYLAHSMVPCYRIADHGRNGLHSICNGGMENCTIRLALKQCKGAAKAEKVSLNAFFKFGERSGEGSTILCWIPGIHTGLALHADVSIHRLFSKSHKDIGYGRGREKKIFKPKHLIKMLVQKVASALSLERGSCFDLDQEADYAYSITPKIPPRYSEYAARCANATDLPEGELKNLLERSELFQKGVEFYPLFQAQSEIQRAFEGQPASARIGEESIFKRMNPIRIFKKAFKSVQGTREVYLLEDKHAKESSQLVYDRDVELRVGKLAAKSLKLHRGGFRKVSAHHSGDLAEHVALHVIEMSPDQRRVGLQHRGCLYVSKLAILEIKSDIENHRIARERLRIEGERSAVNSKYFIWNVAGDSSAQIGTGIDSAVKNQKPIEAGFGAGLLAGGALGLATGAVAGAALARPHPYYYYGYPPPAYPYYVPPPYWKRRRPVVVY
jgi:hypothetical protein